MSAIRTQPVRNFLKERQTLVPHRKLVDMVNMESLRGQSFPLPAGVRPEDALEVIAHSSWAQEMAKGVCGLKYAGFTPGTAEFDWCVNNISHKVAAKQLGMSWAPTTEAAPVRRRR